MTKREVQIVVVILAILIGAAAALFPLPNDPCTGVMPVFQPVGPDVVRRACDDQCFYARGTMPMVICPEVNDGR